MNLNVNISIFNTYNGNQLEIKEVVGEEEIVLRKNLWDEENRLRTVDLNPDADEHHNIAVYTYDASGQRILRHIPTRVDVYSNAVTSGQEERDVTMIYPSGLITAKVLNPESWGRDDEPGPGGSLIEPILRYTKHYYIGTERISSATDTRSNVGYFIDNSNYNDFFPVSTVRQISNETVIVASDALEEVYGSFGLQYTVPAPVVEGSKPTPGYTDFNNASIGWYFFHPDHLGSSSYITNLAGAISQHIEYLPFGELLVDEHLNSHNSPFKFNAKELDPETGNYYYGARYYSPKDNLMLSVDPMWEMYPGISPYAYTLQNPVRYTDPTGMYVEGPDDPPGKVRIILNLGGGADINDAARHRKKQIEKSNPNDKLIYLTDSNLGNLKETIENGIKEATNEGYGKTVEFSVFGHSGVDGPKGGYYPDNQLDLSRETGSDFEKGQMSLENWVNIDFNFDTDASVSAFYGCNTASWAQKFFENTDVKYSVGIAGQSGGTYSTKGDFKVTYRNFLFPASGVYLRSQEGGKVLPLFLYTKGSYENTPYGRMLKERYIYGNATIKNN